MSTSFIEGPPDYAATPQRGDADAPFGYHFADSSLAAVPAAEFPASISADLDGLLHLGYLTDHFNLFGHSFSIRTLRSGEKLAVAQIIKEWEGTLALGEAAQLATVAACLTLVDSRALSAPLGPQENQDPVIWIKRNFAIVQQWYDPVIESVFDRYQNLLVRQTQAFLELQEK